MIYYQNETKQNMFNSYNNMTPVERSIADFFLSNTEKMDFSSKNKPDQSALLCIQLDHVKDSSVYNLCIKRTADII